MRSSNIALVLFTFLLAPSAFAEFRCQAVGDAGQLTQALADPYHVDRTIAPSEAESRKKLLWNCGNLGSWLENLRGVCAGIAERAECQEVRKTDCSVNSYDMEQFRTTGSYVVLKRVPVSLWVPAASENALEAAQTELTRRCFANIAGGAAPTSTQYAFCQTRARTAVCN